MFKIGDKVRIAKDNDNENYIELKDKNLIMTYVATSIKDHPGYDEGLEGMPLYDLKTEDGKEIPFSLYEYELEEI